MAASWGFARVQQDSVVQGRCSLGAAGGIFSVPSAPGNREVIQGGMCTSQELNPGVASLAGQHWLPVSMNSVAL